MKSKRLLFSTGGKLATFSHSSLGAGHSNSNLTALFGGDYFCDKIATTEASIGCNVFIVRDLKARSALRSRTIKTLRPRSSVVTIPYCNDYRLAATGYLLTGNGKGTNHMYQINEAIL